MINKITPSYYSNNYNTKNPSFKGLTNYMERGIMAMDYKKAQAIVDGYDKPHLVIGHFPEDLLAIIKQNSSSSKEISAKIKKFNESFSLQAQNLINMEKGIYEQLDNIDYDEFCYRAILKASKRNPDWLIGHVRLPLKFSFNPEEMEENININEFEKNMKEIGILPPRGKAKFKYIGTGTYKHCYKVDFLDEENSPIVHSKAFVFGKNADIGYECNLIFWDRLKKYIESQDLESFKRVISHKIIEDKTLNNKEKLNAMKFIQPFYEGKYKSSYIFNGATVDRSFYDINGIFPESNAALTIRKDLGKNMKNSDMITPYIFDLKSRWGLMEFSDETLKDSDVKYDFKGHGYTWTDNKAANYGSYCSRKCKLIDYGCIFPVTKTYYD